MLSPYGKESPREQDRRAACIRAELSGSDSATALGIVARSTTPVLSLCRKLIDSGIDPATPLQAWHGDVLALTVRSIGEAAALEINNHGNGFKPLRGRSAAPPVRSNGRGAT